MPTEHVRQPAPGARMPATLVRSRHDVEVDHVAGPKRPTVDWRLARVRLLPYSCRRRVHFAERRSTPEREARRMKRSECTVRTHPALRRTGS